MQRQTPKWGVPSHTIDQIDQWLVDVYSKRKRCQDELVEHPRLDVTSKRPRTSQALKSPKIILPEKKKFPFFRLPRELRDIIYDFALTGLQIATYYRQTEVTAVYPGASRNSKDVKEFPSWLSGSRRVHIEASEQFYSRARICFNLPSQCSLQPWYHSTPWWKVLRARHVTIRSVTMHVSDSYDCANERVTSFGTHSDHYNTMIALFRKSTELRDLTLQIEVNLEPDWKLGKVSSMALPFLGCVTKHSLDRLRIEVTIRSDYDEPTTDTIVGVDMHPLWSALGTEVKAKARNCIVGGRYTWTEDVRRASVRGWLGMCAVQDWIVFEAVSSNYISR